MNVNVNYENEETYEFNGLNGTNFGNNSFKILKEYATDNRLSLDDAVIYIQSCHCCNQQFKQDYDCLYRNGYCSEECEKIVETKECLCYYKYTGKECKLCDVSQGVDKVSYFNERYADGISNFDEVQIEQIKEYARFENLTITDAVEYMSSCHYCGNNKIKMGDNYCNQRCLELSETFCYPCFRGEDCKICSDVSYQNQYKALCYWGEDCSNCKEYSGTEEDRFCCECVNCEKLMTDHEGYTFENGELYCNLCSETIAAVANSKEEEVEKEADYNKRQQELINNYEADYYKREKEFFRSYDGVQDYYLWLEEQQKIHKDDPEFQKNLDLFTCGSMYGVYDFDQDECDQNECEKNENNCLWTEKKEADYDKRYKEFFSSYDGVQDYFCWIEEQKKLHKGDPEFQKNLSLFTYNNSKCEQRKCLWTEEYESYKFAKAETNHLIMEIDKVLSEIPSEKNVIGPISVRRPKDDLWDEFEDDLWDYDAEDYCKKYYYFRKGFYSSVSSTPAPRPGWTSYEIGEDWYNVVKE
jgi:hypothetical protein